MKMFWLCRLQTFLGIAMYNFAINDVFHINNVGIVESVIQVFLFDVKVSQKRKSNFNMRLRIVSILCQFDCYRRFRDAGIFKVSGPRVQISALKKTHI